MNTPILSHPTTALSDHVLRTLGDQLPIAPDAMAVVVVNDHETYVGGVSRADGTDAVQALIGLHSHSRRVFGTCLRLSAAEEGSSLAQQRYLIGSHVDGHVVARLVDGTGFVKAEEHGPGAAHHEWALALGLHQQALSNDSDR